MDLEKKLNKKIKNGYRFTQYEKELTNLRDNINLETEIK